MSVAPDSPLDDLNELLKQVEGMGAPAAKGAQAPTPAAPAPPMPLMSAQERAQPNVRHLLAVPVAIKALLARKRMRLEQLIELRPGQILEFDKTDEEPMELWVGDSVIGRGDTVKVGDRYGVQIQEMIPPRDILRRL